MQIVLAEAGCTYNPGKWWACLVRLQPSQLQAPGEFLDGTIKDDQTLFQSRTESVLRKSCCRVIFRVCNEIKGTFIDE